MRRALAALTLCAAAIPAAAELRAYPSDPRAGEDFVIYSDFSNFTGIRFATFPKSVNLVVGANDLTLDVEVGYGGPVSLLSTCCATVVARGLAAGTYPVGFRAGGTEAGMAGVVSVGAALPAAAPQVTGLAGNWFNPVESGWGVNVLESGSQLFVVWFDQGDPFSDARSGDVPWSLAKFSTWRVLSGGRWISPTTFRGVLYETRDGTYPGGPSTVARVYAVGHASLTFTPSGEMDFTAVMRYGGDLREVSRTNRLRRQEF